MSARRLLVGTIVVAIAASVAAGTTPGERRLRFLLHPKAPQKVELEETAVVRPTDIDIVLEQPGKWWMRYSAQTNHQRCELHEQVELHDLSRDVMKTMNLDGPLLDCVRVGGGPSEAAKASDAMPDDIAAIVSGPLADAAVVQPFARIPFRRLAPLVPGPKPAPRLAMYRVEPTEIDCDADSRHGTPCPQEVKAQD